MGPVTIGLLTFAAVIAAVLVGVLTTYLVDFVSGENVVDRPSAAPTTTTRDPGMPVVIGPLNMEVLDDSSVQFTPADGSAFTLEQVLIDASGTANYTLYGVPAEQETAHPPVIAEGKLRGGQISADDDDRLSSIKEESRARSPLANGQRRASHGKEANVNVNVNGAKNTSERDAKSPPTSPSSRTTAPACWARWTSRSRTRVPAMPASSTKINVPAVMVGWSWSYFANVSAGVPSSPPRTAAAAADGASASAGAHCSSSC